MGYTVTKVDTAADLALAIAAIDEYTELVEVAEVDGGYWLITEPDDDMFEPAPRRCCDCHDDNMAASPSMSMAAEPTDLIKNVTDAIDKFSTFMKTVK